MHMRVVRSASAFEALLPCPASAFEALLPCSALAFAALFRAMADEHVDLARCWRVSGGGCKKVPWVVDECTTVDGIEFVALKRNDTGFVRYILGKSNMTLRDYIFVDEMRKARNKVRFEMLSAEEKSLLNDRESSQYELRTRMTALRLLRWWQGSSVMRDH